MQLRPVDFYHTQGVVIRMSEGFRSRVSLELRISVQCDGQDRVWEQPLQQWLEYVLGRFGLWQRGSVPEGEDGLTAHYGPGLDQIEGHVLWSPPSYMASLRRVERFRRYVQRTLSAMLRAWEEEERLRREAARQRRRQG